MSRKLVPFTQDPNFKVRSQEAAKDMFINHVDDILKYVKNIQLIEHDPVGTADSLTHLPFEEQLIHPNVVAEPLVSQV